MTKKEMENLQKELYGRKFTVAQIEMARNILSDHFGENTVAELTEDEVMVLIGSYMCFNLDDIERYHAYT